MFNLINNIFSPKPNDEPHPREEESNRHEDHESNQNDNNATNEEFEKEELMDADFPTTQLKDNQETVAQGSHTAEEQEEEHNHEHDDEEDAGSIENIDANHHFDEPSKLEILSGWRVNKLQARLKQLGVSFKPKDNNKKLAKLILEHDPDIDLGTSATTHGEGSVPAHSPERKKKDDSIHRYELRSASKKRRSSRILPSPAKKDKNGDGESTEFYYPPVTRTSAAHRRKSHKKSPGKSPMTSPLQSQASQPSTTTSSRRSTRKSESSVPVTVTTTASTASRRGRKKKQTQPVEEEQSVPIESENEHEYDDHSIADQPQQEEQHQVDENTKTNLLSHFEINNFLTQSMPFTDGFEKFDPEITNQEITTQPFPELEQQVQNEFDAAQEPMQEILSADELAQAEAQEKSQPQAEEAKEPSEEPAQEPSVQGTAEEDEMEVEEESSAEEAESINQLASKDDRLLTEDEAITLLEAFGVERDEASSLGRWDRIALLRSLVLSKKTRESVQENENEDEDEAENEEESESNDYPQFKTPMQADPDHGFSGNSGRGRHEVTDEDDEQDGEEDENTTSDDEDYYETNTIEESDIDERDQLPAKPEVVDLLDSSESEGEAQAREDDSEDVGEEENEEFEDETSVPGEENASEEALEKEVIKSFSEDQKKQEDDDNTSLPDQIKANPAVSEAMHAFTKLGSKFIVAITDDQGSNLPSLSEREYELLKNFLEKVKPAGLNEPAPVAPSQPLADAPIATHQDSATEMEVENPKEMSIQTDEEPVEEEKPSINNPPVKQVMFKEPDIFAKSNLNRKVKWDLPEESTFVQSPPAALEYVRTPQFMRQNPTPHRLPTPYYGGAFFSSGSEGTVSSSAKKRNRDEDSEPDTGEDDRARKRISFGGDNPKVSLEINTAIATSDSFSPPDNNQPHSLTPAAISTANPFQSNLKFNLTQNNFLNTGAYIPTFRSSTVQFGGNQRSEIVGRGLSFLEKRKLNNTTTTLPAGSSKPTTANPASGVVAKEILKALSDITTPVEEFRKQPIPRLYPNDIFNGAPKPNIFENNKNNVVPALPAPPTSSIVNKDTTQPANKGEVKSVSFSSSTKPAETTQAPFTFSFNSAPSVPPPSIDTGKRVTAPAAPLIFPKQPETAPQQSSSSSLFTPAAPPKNAFTFESNKPKETSTFTVASSNTTVKQDGEFTFGDPIMDLGDETIPLQPAADPAIKYMFSPPSKNRKRKSEVPSSSTKEPASANKTSTSTGEKEREDKKAKPSVDIWSKSEMNKGVKCPVCMVRNDEKATKCVSCESVLKPETTKAVTPAPAAAAKPATTPSAAPTADIWAKFTSTDDIKCPVCMVRNKKDATKCVSCESALTSSSSSSSSQAKPPVPTTSTGATGAITTGGFQFGVPPADTSSSQTKPAFQFGAPAATVAPAPALDNKPAATGGFTFEFGKSASSAASETSKPSLPELKPINTSGSGFMFGASDNKTSSFSGTSSSPAIIPNLPFTPLPVNSSSHKQAFSPRGRDDDEEDDRSKRVKRKVEEPSSFSSNPVDDKAKLSFSFGAPKPAETTSSTATKESSGGGFTFGSAAPIAALPAATTGGFQFSAGATKTTNPVSTFGSDKPAFGASDAGAPKPFQFGASNTTAEKEKDTKKESLPAPAAPFSFGTATNNTTQSLPSTKPAAFEFGKSASETTTDKKDNATESKPFGAAFSTSTPAPLPSTSTPFGGGAAFTFTAGATKSDKPEEKPAASAAAPAFVFGANKSGEPSAPTAAFDANKSISFSLGTNNNNKPAAISFGSTKKEEPKPPLPPGPPPSSAPFQFGATTGGKITPPPATPFGSSGMNNNSHMMESPNPTEPVAPLNPPPAASSAPFTFGGAPAAPVVTGPPAASNPFTFSAGTTTNPTAGTSLPLFSAPTNNNATPSIPLFGNPAPAAAGGNPFSSGGPSVGPFSGPAALGGTTKGPFGTPLGGGAAAPAFPPAQPAGGLGPFQSANLPAAGGIPLFGGAQPAGPGAAIFGGASTNTSAGPFTAATNPFGGNNGPSAFPPAPSSAPAPFTFNAGGPAQPAAPSAPFMGGGNNAPGMVFMGSGGMGGGGGSSNNLAAMGGPSAPVGGGGGAPAFNIGATDQRKKYKVVKRNSTSQQ